MVETPSPARKTSASPRPCAAKRVPSGPSPRRTLTGGRWTWCSACPVGAASVPTGWPSGTRRKRATTRGMCSGRRTAGSGWASSSTRSTTTTSTTIRTFRPC
uniref:(northern house mosquito) hypothetical protein n=1 Tax=Culex pipiens TaxID=7175 RepID=A0A8D8MIY6_CULPI